MLHRNIALLCCLWIAHIAGFQSARNNSLHISDSTLGSDAPRRSIRWLHCQKCGTTFGNTVYDYACQIPLQAAMPTVQQCRSTHKKERACRGKTGQPIEEYLLKMWPPEKFCDNLILPFAGHSGLGEGTAHNAAAIFREPFQRSRSHFFFDKQVLWVRNGRGPPQRLDFKSRLEDYMKHPAVVSCQTKMVLGHHCNSDHLISDAEFSTAIQLVEHEFLFVGVFEEWAKSIDLFHCLLGGRSRPQIEYTNTRPSNHAAGPDTGRSSLSSEDRDVALYEAVTRRFSRDLQRCLDLVQ
ncbi:hypothetical protein CYMTET_34361 [Cymbomonas tetramitiformis]|uniref:Sulfotransferase n=1 Tax=Cymbomonas tetramitiformis TaxID=36881 RepID=A0AAE0KQ09_9CHLO|nr:hypothetical protein CYMTET_34361 [Cymbomonas tetramitiformis]